MGLLGRFGKFSRYSLLALFMLSALVISGWNGCQDRRIADRLRHDGIEVDAEIVEYRDAGQYEAMVGNKAKVVFQTADGQRVETWIVVGTDRKLHGPTRMRYLRTDPAVARLVTDTAPRAGALAFYLILFAVLGLVGAALFWFFREMDRQLGLR